MLRSAGIVALLAGLFLVYMGVTTDMGDSSLQPILYKGFGFVAICLGFPLAFKGANRTNGN